MIKKRQLENKVSLNEKSRRMEIEQDKVKKDARTAARAKNAQVEPKVYALTLDNVTKKEELKLVVNEKVEKKTPEEKVVEEKKVAATDEDGETDEDVEVTVKASKNDPIKTETLNILCDLISLSVPVKVETASVVK